MKDIILKTKPKILEDKPMMEFLNRFAEEAKPGLTSLTVCLAEGGFEHSEIQELLRGVVHI